MSRSTEKQKRVDKKTKNSVDASTSNNNKSQPTTKLHKVRQRKIDLQIAPSKNRPGSGRYVSRQRLRCILGPKGILATDRAERRNSKSLFRRRKILTTSEAKRKREYSREYRKTYKRKNIAHTFEREALAVLSLLDNKSGQRHQNNQRTEVNQMSQNVTKTSRKLRNSKRSKI